MTYPQLHHLATATERPQTAPVYLPDRQRMRMRYGFNEIYGAWHLAEGSNREKISQKLRAMGTQVVRVFVFDQPVPDPVKEWSTFAGVLQTILDSGAKPMVTFAKFHPPYDNPANIKNFVERCTEVVWGCIEQWGGNTVKDWFWCVWNEPNNPIVGGDLTFEQYCRIYKDVAGAILQLLEPHLGGKKALIGGPAIDSTHRHYWMDWIARLVTEVDDRMVGFVSWHRYGDWRPAVPSSTLELEMWNSPDAPRGETFESLIMAQIPSYEAHARGVARLLKGRDILNVCGELNAISHHEQYYTLGLNQNAFGAAYYISALIHLLRGGADLEMRWTATGHDDRTDAYSLMTMNADLMPAGLAKQLFAQAVRFGDWISFPSPRRDAPDVDIVIASGEDGRWSCIFVNTSAKMRTLNLDEWVIDPPARAQILRIDKTSGSRVVKQPFDGTISMNGYCVAAVTNMMESVLD